MDEIQTDHAPSNSMLRGFYNQNIRVGSEFTLNHGEYYFYRLSLHIGSCAHMPDTMHTDIRTPNESHRPVCLLELNSE